MPGDGAGAVGAGHDVVVQAGAGQGSGIPDDAYTAAKGDAKATKAVAEQDATQFTGAAKDAREDKSDAQYSAAKERCDAMSGQAKDTCIADAKKKFGKS